jgi:hypothetical protein
MQQFVQGFLSKSSSGEWRTMLELVADEENKYSMPNLRNRDYNDLAVPFARLVLTGRFPFT